MRPQRDERKSFSKLIDPDCAPTRWLSSIASVQYLRFRRPTFANVVKEKPKQRRTLILFMLLLSAVTLAAQSRKLRPGFNLFSKEQDIQLGKESAVEVEKKMKVLDNPELQAYVAAVGKN
jgi:hypothetical protein